MTSKRSVRSSHSLRRLYRAGLAVAFGALTGCAHSVHQVHTSDFGPYKPVEAGRVVRSSTEQFTILGFVGDTAYIDQAYQKLMAACPEGTVTSITTQLATSLGFFSWTNKVLMQGLCLKSSKTAAN